MQLRSSDSSFNNPIESSADNPDDLTDFECPRAPLLNTGEFQAPLNLSDKELFGTLCQCENKKHE